MYALIVLVFLLLTPAQTIEFSCMERDGCHGRIINHRNMNDSGIIKERNCFCDQACFQYDDCCEDIKHSQIKQAIQAICVDYMYPFRIRSERYESTVMPVWMITTCLTNYQYTQLEKNCTNFDEDNDFFLFNPPAYIPMTSRRTNLTYRNIYCALCNNEKIDSLMNWSLEIVCNGLKQNYIFNYQNGLNIIQLPPEEAERCINRLSFPSPPAIVYPCKQHTINSCPGSFVGNQTIINLCSTINAYRYVTHSHPTHMYVHSLYRNEYCLMCHNVTNSVGYLETSCEHQLDDELINDPKPKTGRRGVYRLSILFDPTTFSIQMPILSISDHQYHSSYQTHFTKIYPCRYFEVYDYFLHACIILRNEDDWRLTRSLNCTNPLLLRNQILKNNSMVFFSHQLYRQLGDFVMLFSDAKKLIICGERFPLVYIHHSRFITTIRYLSTVISLLSLLIFLISFHQKSTLHNLPGKCLLMLSISLQLSQSMFLASGHLLEYSNHFWCICSGIGVHLFYLSTFAWLSAISFDTCLALTRMNRLDARIARNRFILYNIFVWVFSVTIVLISICLQLILPKNHPWSPNYGGILCSISSRYALITFFLIPIGFLVTINVMIFTRSIFVVRRIDQETQLARGTSRNDRSRAFLYFRLAMLMGLHWICLVICIVFKQDILWLLFDVINSLPGLFIAISFLRKKTSLSDLKAKFRSSQSQLSSLGIGNNTVTTMNRCISSNIEASPTVQMSRRLDDITQKLDKLTRHLLKPNTFLSTPAFHRSASSL